MSTPTAIPRSPKRNGIVVEHEDGPVGDNISNPRPFTPHALPPDLPRLSLSSTSSNECLDTMMPSTPTDSLLPLTPVEEKENSMSLLLATSTEAPVSLPGFHFSTMDEDVDPAEFHRVAAQLLSGEAVPDQSTVADHVVHPITGRRITNSHTTDRHITDRHITDRQLHCDLGRDPSGRYCCSCGKSYSTSFRLREHIKQCAGTAHHPCPTCDNVYETREQLNRHIASRHNNNLESCPECGNLYPAHLLPKHLASGLGGCDGMVQIPMLHMPDIDETHERGTRKSTSQRYWIDDDDHRWTNARASARQSFPDSGTEEEDDVVDQTMSYLRRLLKKPSSRLARDTCDLCGATFSAETDGLARHIGTHSLEFAEKRHKCDDCRIFFANEKDLERHVQSADLNQHCGFTFRHVAGTCGGHHPPTYFKPSATNDHALMQKHLWAWELAQLRTHRVTVARLLAERLNRTSSKPMTLQDCRRTYDSLLPHVSIASRDSIAPESIGDADTLDVQLSRILSEAFPEPDARMLEGIPEAEAAPEIRSASSVVPDGEVKKRVSERRSWMGFATKRKSHSNGGLGRVRAEEGANGHKRTHSGPIGFLKQASREASRPQSLPSAPRTMQVKAV
ncbi:Zinc finger with KRAB and SCAN domains 5 [Lecanosticta acicola]|uniref:Zinc finger with KRAB and SCAN domains 5 n=1 Tax=Lecanosticta acicola TaxID=111012 RepID=A0AAI8YTC9_9PEZI|nr:Zinc finger with KRAB and SCAN domains 5 [Lecanosticta acicola]